MLAKCKRFHLLEPMIVLWGRPVGHSIIVLWGHGIYAVSPVGCTQRPVGTKEIYAREFMSTQRPAGVKNFKKSLDKKI